MFKILLLEADFDVEVVMIHCDNSPALVSRVELHIGLLKLVLKRVKINQ